MLVGLSSSPSSADTFEHNMSVEHELYEYESLQDRPVDTTRLITLQPGLQHEPIRCTLTYAQQSEQPQYSALSYVWGTDKSDHAILVNNGVVFVKQNLDSCLRHLRHAEIPMQIWADAICINQGDARERGHQVGLMGGIYKDAQSVYIWLGEDTHNIAPCLKGQYTLSIGLYESPQKMTSVGARETPGESLDHERPEQDIASLERETSTKHPATADQEDRKTDAEI